MAASELGASSHSREDSNWRKDLILQLQERNKKQTYCFLDLISLRKISFHVILNIVSYKNLSDILSTCYYYYILT